MKRAMRLIFTSLLLAGFGAFLFAFAQRVEFGPDGNAVSNPGFEQWNKGLPADWNLEGKVAGKGAVTQAKSPVHGGRWSLMLAPNSRNTAVDLGGSPFGLGQAFSLNALRGKRVYVSAWLGAEGGATATAGVYALTKRGQVIAGELKEPSGGRSGLSSQETFLDVPNDPNIAFVVFLCMVYGTSGSAYFDDLHIGLQPARASTPSNDSDLANGPLQAEITVDAQRTIRNIPDELYGTNIEWIWDGNGIWDSNRNQLNEEAVTLTRDLGPSLLRFPGAMFADFYHWRDGIGNQQLRKEKESMPGGARSRNAFGTDEALMFADKVNSRLMITVNASTGTPQEAAEWVRYVNKGGRRVEYWEIGNENYVKDGSPAAKASTMPPDGYARRVLDFAKAMREADSSIKIGAIGEESLNPAQPKGYPDWTEKVLRTAGRQIDFIAVHNAYAPGLSTDKGWSVRTVYGAMLAAPALVRQSLEQLAAKIDALVPGSDMKIAVTEFGPYFQITPDGRFVDHVKTLGSALYVGSLMKAFIESPRVDIANAFKLVDPLFMGWIGKRGEHLAPTGPYYASQMYRRHFGRKLVESRAQSPTYTSESVGIVERVRQVPYLDVIASSSQDGDRLYILAVNKHFDKSIRAAIDLRGFRPLSGSAWVLNGTGIDSNTGTAPVKVGAVNWARQAVDEVDPQFDKGSPDTLQIHHVGLREVAQNFQYEFPAHSIVSLEFER